MDRLVFHIDMDAFYASVEQMDNPSCRGKPVVVGADPKQGNGRGVVSAASYEARKYGIHSAMPVSRAYRLCPWAVFVPVRMSRYKEISNMFMGVLSQFSPCIEPISLDEAFLDMTGTERLMGNPEKIARSIKDSIMFVTGLCASVGAAPNKLVAKIASDREKPDGLVIVDKNRIQAFMDPLPVGALWGVGKKTEKHLHALGFRQVKDIRQLSVKELCSMFGRVKGEFLYNTCRGIDDRPVQNSSSVKSVSNEITFNTDTSDMDYVRRHLLFLSEKVAFRLRKQNLAGKTIYMKIRFDDFSTYVRNKTVSGPVFICDDIFPEVCNLLNSLSIDKRVRLVGVGVTQLEPGCSGQTALPFGGDEKKEKAAEAVDRIKEKFGESVITRGKRTRRT